jgi:6,7-dimethyl-8-ribityllumazine synthase
MADISHEIRYAGGGNHTNDRIAIVVSKWLSEITESMYQKAVAALQAYGVRKISRFSVPGAYELPIATKLILKKNTYDAIIAIGCVLTGETKHNVYISQAVMTGLMKVSLKFNTPIIMGVLTPDTPAQAKARIAKGTELAVAALEMIDLKRTLKRYYFF